MRASSLRIGDRQIYTLEHTERGVQKVVVEREGPSSGGRYVIVAGRNTQPGRYELDVVSIKTLSASTTMLVCKVIRAVSDAYQSQIEAETLRAKQVADGKQQLAEKEAALEARCRKVFEAGAKFSTFVEFKEFCDYLRDRFGNGWRKMVGFEEIDVFPPYRVAVKLWPDFPWYDNDVTDSVFVFVKKIFNQ